MDWSASPRVSSWLLLRDEEPKFIFRCFQLGEARLLRRSRDRHRIFDLAITEKDLEGAQVAVAV